MTASLGRLFKSQSFQIMKEHQLRAETIIIDIMCRKFHDYNYTTIRSSLITWYNLCTQFCRAVFASHQHNRVGLRWWSPSSVLLSCRAEIIFLKEFKNPHCCLLVWQLNKKKSVGVIKKQAMSPHSVEQGPLVAALIPRDTRVKKMFSLVPFPWSNPPTDHNSPTGQEGDAVVHSGLWQVGNGADIRRREELNGGQDVWVCVAAYDHLPCCL